MKRKMTRTDVKQITELVRAQYRGNGARGKPIIEVGQKFELGGGTTDVLFWDHNGRKDGSWDLFDNWLLKDVQQMSSKGDPDLQVYPGFTLDLYIYIPDLYRNGECVAQGEIWGNLDAVWTGDAWDVFCPFDRERRQNGGQS